VWKCTGASMRRNKTHQRGRARLLSKFQVSKFQVSKFQVSKFQVRLVQALVVCAVVYVMVGSRTVVLRGADLSAAETVALRFPENWDNAPAVPRVLVAAIGKARTVAHAVDDARSAWLSPEPMMPQATPLQAATPSSTRREPDLAAAAEVKVAAADTAVPQLSSEISALVQAPVLPAATKVASLTVKETRVAVPAVRHVVNRPGYMLNDSQIASIKARLHLTPDQERMWPGVEVALRNMAYTHAPDARGRGNPTNDSAAVDPDSVQGLKSAAVPLILSFNTEQKDEVRNIVHVMGLDQLASQF
jgi:hypothetical protein